MSAVLVPDVFGSSRFTPRTRIAASARPVPRAARTSASPRPVRSATSTAATSRSVSTIARASIAAPADVVAQPRLRITRRGRALLTTLASVPLVASGLVIALNGGPAVATGESVTIPLQTVTVESGQMLWGIAEAVAPTADPRDVIASIMELNRLSSANVFPGQELSLPRSLG
ncbi:LysM peptidoglycan-binding domain-containing protein [Planctomonas psychrotolerans]|uniref:LysM peptidoglycan-binding domain-containing protein n=1 Tax=Planctomonas psychrotolerans TaxID=2528712 RepID=UPI00123860A6|nr:LysM peptidoglycan-binding domain-containing protein [Planctomonas psychrotolerans]